MILVDVMVPCLDKTYDFWLDENTEIRLVIEELTEVIGQKEKAPLAGNRRDLQLCDKGEKRVLLKNGTLYSEGIKMGGTLILL